jgi:DNA polymerase V
MQYSNKLLKHKVQSIWDFINLPAEWIKKNFTMKGLQTYKELKGIPSIPLEEIPNSKKQIISGRSFGRTVSSLQELFESVVFHLTLSHKKLISQKSACTHLMVFIQTDRFKTEEPQYSRSKVINLEIPTNYLPDLLNAGEEALKQIYKDGYQFKKAGVMLAGILPDKSIQMCLFDSREKESKKAKLNKTINQIQSRFGYDSINNGSLVQVKGWGMRRNYKSPHYTTNWNDLPRIKT